MSAIGDIGRAIAQAIRGVNVPNTAPNETRKVLREMDRNIASNRRIRAAADGVVQRLAARGNHQ